MALLEEVLPAFRKGSRIRLDGASWLDPKTYEAPWAVTAMNLSGLISDKWEVEPQGLTNGQTQDG